MSTRIRGTALACSVAVAVGALTGCSTGTTEAGGAPASLPTVRVGVASKSAGFLPLYIGIEKGYFAEAGVSVTEPTVLSSGARLAAAMVGDSVDIGIGVAPDVFNLHAAGQPVVLLGSIYASYSVDIVAGPSINTPATADLDSKIAALSGKKIGITGPGSGTEALLSYLFKRVGRDAKTQAELVSLGADPAAAITALRSGQVDALSHVLSVGQQAEALGAGRLYISPGRGDVPELVGAVHGTAFSLKPVVDRKRPAVAAFLAGYQRSMRLLKSNPGEARAIAAKYLAGLSDEVIDKLLPVLAENTPAALAVDPKGFQAEADVVYSTGLVSGSRPALADLVDPSLLPWT